MKQQFVDLIVAIADGGSLAAAGNRLNKSQPAITKALKAIESDLGVQLFHRLPGGVVPTDVGQVVIERSRRIAVEVKKLREDVSQSTGEPTGSIRVLVSPTPAMRLIPNVLRRLNQRYPRVRLDIVSWNAETDYARLRAGEADFVIGPAPSRDNASGLVIRKLFETKVSFITGSGSRYLHHCDIADLAKAKWIMVGHAERQPAYFEHFTQAGLMPPDPIAICSSSLAALSMIEGSDLLCDFATLAIPEVKERWGIAELPIKPTVRPVPIVMASEKGKILTKPELLFSDLVNEAAQNLR